MSETRSFRADPTKMEIVSDPMPPGCGVTAHKYGNLFETLKPGQAIRCHSDDVARVSTSMRKWAKSYHPGCSIRSVKTYPGDLSDKRGRVWLLDAPRQKLKHAA